MLTSKKRAPRPVGTIKMRCPAGVLVPRPASGMVVPKWQRFYNWPRDASGSPMPDAPDFPRAADIPEVVIDVPRDEYHARLIYRGACSVVDAPATAPVPVKSKRDKE